MRAPTQTYLQQLPARKRVTLAMLFVLCGGVFASGGALACGLA